MKALLAALVLGLALAAAAMAQQQPDPRLAAPMVRALQAMLELRDAERQAMAEDFQKRIAELERMCGDLCKQKPEIPAK